MQNIDICSNCKNVIDINPKIKPKVSNPKYLCEECFKNAIEYISNSFVSKTDFKKSLEPYFHCKKVGQKKYLRDRYLELQDITDLLHHNVTQSFWYGDLSKEERLKMITNFSEEYSLNFKRLITDCFVDYFIEFGLHKEDDDETFLLKLRQLYKESSYNFPKIDLLENNYLETQA